MNRYSYIIILLLCLPGIMFAQEKEKSESVKANAKAPMTYEAFFKKDMKKVDGVFPVYQNDKKCYLEIPANRLEKNLLASGIILKGPWNGNASSITDIIVFSLGNRNQLEVKKQICTDRAEGELAQAVEASALKPVLFSYPIVAYGKNKQGYIIDITSDVNASGKIFAFPNLQWVDRPDATRSGLDSVYVISNGVKFMSLHTQTDYMPGLAPGQMGYDKNSSVLIEWTLQVLPEHKMAEREADIRVGFTVLSYNDYDSNPYQVEKKNIVRRWNLQVKPEDAERYNRGELVEPAIPISVYLDNSFSETLRASAIRGIEEWNCCFEQAGFKNVLQVQAGEPEAAFAYHQLVYSFAGVGVKKNHTVTNPFTAEIICGNIHISGFDLRDMLRDMPLRLGGYEPAAFTDSLPVIREEGFRCLVSFATGNVLGLTRNIAAGTVYTTKQLRDAAWLRENGISSSVTSGDMVNYVVQPGDNIPLRDLFAKASHYDRWAIEWGYRQFPGMDAAAEKKALKAIAEQAKNNPFLDRTYRFDARDRLSYAVLGMENLKRLLPNLENIANQLDQDDMWYTYMELIPYAYMLYNSYATMGLEYVGNIMWKPIIAGYNEEAMLFTSKAQQEEGMRFLEKYIFSGLPVWMDNQACKKVAGFNGESTIVKVSANVLGRLMSPNVLASMMVDQVRNGKSAYTMDDLFGALDRIVFLNYSATKPISRYAARMQYGFWDAFLKTYSKLDATKSPDELSLYLVNKLSMMTKSIEKLGKTHSDVASRQHYRGLSVYLKQKLSPNKKEAGIPTGK